MVHLPPLDFLTYCQRLVYAYEARAASQLQRAQRAALVALPGALLLQMPRRCAYATSPRCQCAAPRRHAMQRPHAND
jgi:hypothetical protein